MICGMIRVLYLYCTYTHKKRINSTFIPTSSRPEKTGTIGIYSVNVMETEMETAMHSVSMRSADITTGDHN